MWVSSFINPNMNNNYHSCSLLDSWTLKIQEKSRVFANFHVVIDMNFDLKRALTFMVMENMLFGMDAVLFFLLL